jgi:L-ribulokinase
VLVPSKSVVSLGAAIFAFLAAGTFNTVEEAQEQMCPPYKEDLPDSAEQSVYEVLYSLYSKLYFAFGTPGSGPMSDVLPQLIQTAQSVRRRSTASKIDAGS